VQGCDVTANSSRDWRTDVASNSYSAALAVAYKVDGKEYLTSKVHFGEMAGSSDPSEGEMTRLRYPVGAAFPVACHPSDPYSCCAQAGLQRQGADHSRHRAGGFLS
jgi:hypothetical protein